MMTRILVVDDSLTVRMELKEALSAFDVACVASGEEAIDFLGAQSADIIFMDLGMPGLSGIETCKIIKLNPGWRDIPVVIFTAQSGKETLVECLKAGAANYIVKSDDYDLLKACIHNMLSNLRGFPAL